MLLNGSLETSAQLAHQFGSPLGQKGAERKSRPMNIPVAEPIVEEVEGAIVYEHLSVSS